jgi:uncharacterized membrane protein
MKKIHWNYLITVIILASLLAQGMSAPSISANRNESGRVQDPWSNVDTAIPYIAQHFAGLDPVTGDCRWTFTDPDEISKADDFIADIFLIEHIRDKHRDDTVFTPLGASISLILDSTDIKINDGIDIERFILTILKDGNFLKAWFQPLISNGIYSSNKVSSLITTFQKQATQDLDELEKKQNILNFNLGEINGLQISLKEFANVLVKHWNIAHEIEGKDSIDKTLKDYERGVEILRGAYEFCRNTISEFLGDQAALKAAPVFAISAAATGPFAIAIGAIGAYAVKQSVDQIFKATLDSIFLNTIDQPLYKRLDVLGVKLNLVHVKVIDIVDTRRDHFVAAVPGYSEELIITVENVGARHVNLRITPENLPYHWFVWDTDGIDLDNYMQKTFEPGEREIFVWKVESGGQDFLGPYIKGVNPANIIFRMEHDLREYFWDIFAGLIYLRKDSITLFNIPTPFLNIKVESVKTVYAPGSIASMTIKVTNNGSATADFTLGVSIRYIFDPESKQLSGCKVSPSLKVQLPKKLTTSFAVTCPIPSNARTGQYIIAVNGWWEPYFGDHYYPDDLLWSNAFVVGELKVEILRPTSSSPARAGAYANPIPFEIRIMISGLLTISNKDILIQIPEIGASPASTDIARHNIVGQEGDIYIIQVRSPSKPHGGHFDLVLRLVQGGAILYNGRVSNAILFYNGLKSVEDIMLVIDKSGSMESEGKLKSAVAAANKFVQFSGNWQQVGLVSFSTTSTLDIPLAPIEKNQKTKLFSALEAISVGGSTSMGAGLSSALNSLKKNGRNGAAWVIIILSDGMENTIPYVKDIMQDLINYNVLIFSIGLGSDVDSALLSNLAWTTGGRYYFSPTGSQLQEIYHSITGLVEGQNQAGSISGTIGGGGRAECGINFTIPIDSTVTEATITLVMSYGNIEMVLVDPLGDIINSTVAEGDPYNYTYEMGQLTSYFILKSPIPGQWEVRLESLNQKGDEFTVKVFVDSDILFSSGTNRGCYYKGEPIRLYLATVAPTGTISDIQATIKAEFPGGDSTAIIVYDDGMHGDSDAGDGVYSGFFMEDNKEGNYRFLFNVTGLTADGTRFQREGQTSVFVNASIWENLKARTPNNTSTISSGKAEIPIALENNGTIELEGLIQTSGLSLKDTFEIKIPDVASNRIALSLSPDENTTVMIRVTIPPNTSPGLYEGNILVLSNTAVRIPFCLTVEEGGIEIQPYHILEVMDPSKTTSSEIQLVWDADLDFDLRTYMIGEKPDWVYVNSNIIHLDGPGTIDLSIKLSTPLDASPGQYPELLIIESDNIQPQCIPIMIIVPNRNLSIEILDEPGILMPGGCGNYTLYVTNVGNVQITANPIILRDGTSTWNVTSGTGFSLREGEFTCRYVKINLPHNVSPGPHTIVLEIKDTEGRILGSKELLLVVSEIYGIQITGTPSITIAPETNTTTSINLENKGNVAERFLLSYDDLFWITLTQSEISVEPFSTTSVNVTFSPSMELKPTNYNHSIFFDNKMHSFLNQRFNLSIEVLPHYNFSAEGYANAITLKSNDNKILNFTLDNKGNAEQSVHYTSSVRNVTGVSLNPEEGIINLSPGVNSTNYLITINCTKAIPGNGTIIIVFAGENNQIHSLEIPIFITSEPKNPGRPINNISILPVLLILSIMVLLISIITVIYLVQKKNRRRKKPAFIDDEPAFIDDP